MSSNSNINIQKYKIPQGGETRSINNTPVNSNKFLIILLDITQCVVSSSDADPFPPCPIVNLNINFTPPEGFIIKIQISSSITAAEISLNLYYNNSSGASVIIYTANRAPDTTSSFIYSNYTWNLTDSNLLLQNVLTTLSKGSVPSNENPLSTSNTVGGIIKESLTGYLDTSIALPKSSKFSNSRALPYSTPSPNTLSPESIVTVNTLPSDLYNMLDVSSNPNINVPANNQLGENKLITTEFSDYLNYFISALKKNSDFVSSVANQIVDQCNLNDIELEVGLTITLTYPSFLRQSLPYISYIIPLSTEGTNSYIDAVVLNTGSQITYLGSNIIPVNTQDLGIKYNNSPTSYNLPIGTKPDPSPFVFTIIASSSSNFNFSDGEGLLKGIYMLDSAGNLVQDTQTSLVDNTITYTYKISLKDPSPPNLPFYIYILYNNNIYYNESVNIYINDTITPPTPKPIPAPKPYLPSYEFSISGNAISDNTLDIVNNNNLTVTPNTLVNFTITACDAVFDDTYTVELAILDSITNKLITITEATPFALNTTLNTINIRLYGYDKLPINPESSYKIVAIITQLNSNNLYEYYTAVYTEIPVDLTVVPAILQPTPLISFINNEAEYLFPLYNFVAVQGDTINFYIYSKKPFTKNVIYFNGEELIAYTKTANDNTYSGGSTSYVNYEIAPENDLYPEYHYYVIIPMRLTLPASLPTPESLSTSVFPPNLNSVGTKYYITVATTMLDDDGGSYSTYYSTEQLTLYLQLKTKLIAHGYLVNGIVTPSVINNGIDNIKPNDINAFATVNGLIIPPDNSLFYYQTADSNYNGYFYVKTSNTVKYETPSPSEGLFCFQGQGYGTIITPIAPTSYHTIINDMINYFIKMAIQYGFIFRSEIEAYKNNTFGQQYLTLQNLINYIELSTRNTYLCGIYTTNIYIVGNSIPVGTSYYPNNVAYQGSNGRIPSSGQYAPNPDINGLVNGFYGATGGISSLYYNGSNGNNGPFWGVTGDMSLIGNTDQITTPINWIGSPNFPTLPSTTSVNNFRGSNSVTELNNTLLAYSEQLKYCSKNIIIIPEDYVGYGLINGANNGACSQPDYILTIHLNTYGIYNSTASGSNGCSTTQATLNGSIISPGSEVNIINNSPNAIVKVISYNLATNPPTPLIINLGNTTMDSLYIKATDSMHLIFGGSTWGIL